MDFVKTKTMLYIILFTLTDRFCHILEDDITVQTILNCLIVYQTLIPNTVPGVIIKGVASQNSYYIILNWSAQFHVLNVLMSFENI